MAQEEYRCEECGAIFSHREDLERHSRTNHSRFTCDICGETLGSESELQTHNQIAHPQTQNSSSD